MASQQHPPQQPLDERNPTPPPKEEDIHIVADTSAATLANVPEEDPTTQEEKPKAAAAASRRSPLKKNWEASKKKHNYKVKIHNVATENWRDILRWRASVLPSVLLPTLALTVWSTLVCIFFLVKDVNFLAGRLPNSVLLITVLGIVMGLLLVFRTNTSYDRYWEGRRLWGIALTQIRNLARLVWINVATKSDDDAAQKRGAMNLIIAFGCSIKHYLRMEDGHLYDDLGPFLAHLPEYGVDATSPTISPVAGGRSMKNLPLDITFHLQAYVTKCRRTDQIDIPTQGAMTTSLSALVDCLSGFERIRDSPIPLAYSIHLKQTLLLYLLSLPFQLVPGIFWGTIPAVTIAAFTLLGIEAIGGQIENPFGYDENDLPQDVYTEEVREEIFSVMRGCESEERLLEKYDAGRWLEPFRDISIAHLHEGAAKEREAVVDVDGGAGGRRNGTGWLASVKEQ
ncbi:hypothetical protein HDU67_004908 [Dinochytrium kinnereticum]|nr:hypothetical protein HDU67_004908 [Dinochytrium kinnereticum]